MQDILVPLAAIIAVVWAATEALGRAFPVRKEVFAMALGPLTGVVTWRLGFLPLPGELGVIEGLATAAFIGLLATFAAEKAHDRGAKPIAKALKGKK